MPVISFRGANYPFWYHLGYQDGTPTFLAIKVSFTVAREEILNAIRLCWCSTPIWHTIFKISSQPFLSFRGQIKLQPRKEWSPLGFNSKIQTTIPAPVT